MLRELVFLCALSLSYAYTQDALADQVKNLPGAEKLNIKFNQFSGYLDIPGTSGEKTKHMHYWFVESMNKPSTDPLTFWTNGGKFCSEFIFLPLILITPTLIIIRSWMLWFARFHDRTRSIQASC